MENRISVLAVVLAACNPSAPPPPVAMPPDTSAAVAALAAEVVALRARVEEVEARPVVKVPWFVDGETREPIGRVLDYGDRIAWSDAIGDAVMAYASPVAYTESDCRGDARIVVSPRARFAVIPDGTVVEVGSGAGDFAVASVRNPGKDCENASPLGMSARRFTPTAIRLPPVNIDRVAVDLR